MNTQMHDKYLEAKKMVIENIKMLSKDKPFMIMVVGEDSESFVFSNMSPVDQIGTYEIMKWKKLKEVEEWINLPSEDEE